MDKTVDVPTSNPGAWIILSIILVIVVGVVFLMRSKTSRIIKYDVNTLVTTSFLLVILFLVNAIPVAMHELVLGSVHIPLEGRKDFTQNERNSISDDTVKQLQALNEDINVTAFYRLPSPEQQAAKDLLDQYTFYTPHLKINYIDPVVDRAGTLKYRDLLRIIDPRGGATILPGTVVLELPQPEGATAHRVSVQLPLSGRPGDAETKLTNGIFQVLKKDKQLCYFITGHGEHTPDAPKSGLDKAKEVLQDSMFDSKPLSLLKEGKVTGAEAVVIICGPQKDYDKAEIDALRTFVNGGGRLMAMIDPTVVVPNLQAFLAEYGCQLGDDIAFDPSHGWGSQPLFPVVATFSQTSPITAGYDIACYFPEARSVQPVAKAPATVTVDQVAKTLDTTYGIKLANGKPPEQITIDPKRDQKGPITLMMSAVVKPSPSPSPSSSPAASPSASPSPEPREGRIVVYGCSGFILDRMYLLAGNGDLFIRSVNWLAQSKDTQIVQHAVFPKNQLILTEAQKGRVQWISMFLIPGTIAMIGLLVFMAFKPN